MECTTNSYRKLFVRFSSECEYLQLLHKENKIQLQLYGSSPRQAGAAVESYGNGSFPLNVAVLLVWSLVVSCSMGLLAGDRNDTNSQRSLEQESG